MPERVERLLRGDPRDIEHRVAQHLDGQPAAERRRPDRAVDRDDTGGMAQDFSWPNSAQKYLELYKKLMNETTTALRTTNGIGLREG